MATSEVSICRMALLNAGSKATINSLDESSKEAGYCKTYYAHCRDMLLRGFDWKFAQKRRTLASTGETLFADWDYGYEYPSDCLAFRRIFQTNRRGKQIPFEIGSKADLTGKIILTDEQFATGVYTAKLTNPELFDSLFVDTLASLVSSKIARVLVTKPERLVDIDKGYSRAVNAAIIAGRIEEEPDEAQDNAFTLARV